jgi:hypothetical protein
MVDLLNQEQAELQKAMIEKIKLIIDERCEAELGQVHASSMGGKVTKTVSTKLIAEDIYEYLIKDSVVLSREQFKILCEDKVEITHLSIDEEFKKECEYEIKQASKETAEKILNKGKQLVEKWLSKDDEKVGFMFDFEEFIKKQFNVKIKE